MKFKVKESYDDWKDEITPDDIGLYDYDFIKAYIEKELGLEKARKLWIEKVYPLLPDKDKEEIATFDSIEDYVNDFDSDELAEDFAYFDIVDVSDLYDNFEEWFASDIYDYIKNVERSEAEKAELDAYWRSTRF